MNNEDSGFIIPEAKPFRFRLDYEIDILRVNFPYVVNENEKNKNVFLRVNLLNNIPIKIRIQIGFLPPEEHILYYSKISVWTNFRIIESYFAYYPYDSFFSAKCDMIFCTLKCVISLEKNYIFYNQGKIDYIAEFLVVVLLAFPEAIFLIIFVILFSNSLFFISISCFNFLNPPLKSSK